MLSEKNNDIHDTYDTKRQIILEYKYLRDMHENDDLSSLYNKYTLPYSVEFGKYLQK